MEYKSNKGDKMKKKCWNCLYDCKQKKETRLNKCRIEQLISKVSK